MTNVFGLPALAVALVGAVLGVQLAYGGADYEPLPTADPCLARSVATPSEGIEGLAERLVLLGIDGAACQLRISREALTLELAEQSERTEAEIDALREGLHGAVDQMLAEGSLPEASALVSEALDEVALNGIVERLIRALPDRIVNAALKTDDVLHRAIDALDLRELVANLDDLNDLEKQVEDAVVPAVQDSVVARLKDLI